MKPNPFQIAASAAGAVLAAVIASFFGVEGTIIGVAIGSIVATTASAIVGESLRRTHTAVRHVVVKNADQLPFLHRGSPTRAAGDVTDAVAAGTAVSSAAGPPPGTDGSGTAAAGAAAGGAAAGAAAGGAAAGAVAGAAASAETGTAASGEAEAAVHSATGELTGPPGPGGTAQGAAGLRFVTSSRAGRQSAPAGSSPTPPVAQSRRRPGWKVLVVSGVAVFLLGLGVVTLVEVAAGRPLSSLLGSNGADSGTTAGNLLTGTPPSTTTTTTSTTVPSNTTTTTPPPTTTTTPHIATTTTTTPSTTTTTMTASSTTTTTSAGAAGSSG